MHLDRSFFYRKFTPFGSFICLVSILNPCYSSFTSYEMNVFVRFGQHKRIQAPSHNSQSMLMSMFSKMQEASSFEVIHFQVTLNYLCRQELPEIHFES